MKVACNTDHNLDKGSLREPDRHALGLRLGLTVPLKL